jgi:hypothetical protein
VRRSLPARLIGTPVLKTGQKNLNKRL